MFVINFSKSFTYFQFLCFSYNMPMLEITKLEKCMNTKEPDMCYRVSGI